ncbi:MAG: maleylpyruvate isomerase family mycothiol-dependent enzyme [Gemmatimonadales bacterium]|nr:maleylpyruvate isomerase family mycothiol-dependent enzyme [Gemmatimonadales bacterium]MBA3555281.1 maleylpyruvate isomerase family mycothiol-dependent enzyme [Gemmatimonadales bacterium]
MSTDLCPVRPVYLADRFAPLHIELIALLEQLAPEDWERPTTAGLWSVRDVVAHLLDTSLRRLSFQRDGMLPKPDRPIASHRELVTYLDRLNAEWVAAARRLSPAVLLELHRFTGPRVAELFLSLDPHAPALFPVAWAGESSSENWFDVGREYTERWLHQTQIRDAVGAPGLVSREWLHPVLDLFLRALPHVYREITRKEGAAIGIEIAGDAGGSWTLVREGAAWRLYEGRVPAPAARLALSQDTAWRLFSKGLPQDSARQRVTVEGDAALRAPLLGALAIMATPAPAAASTV